MKLIIPLLLFVLASFSLPAQPQRYPGLQLVSQQQAGQVARFTVKKWDQVFHIHIQRQGEAVLIRLHDASRHVIGAGKVGVKGGKRLFSLEKSVRGLGPIWHFALDRIGVRAGKLAFQAFEPDPTTPLMDCQLCCYEAHLQALGLTDDAYVKQQIKEGKGPKSWGWYYELPPDDARVAYLDCVDTCLAGEGCPD